MTTKVTEVTAVRIRNTLQVTEQLDDAPAVNGTVVSAQFDRATTNLTQSTTPPATRAVQMQVTLSAAISGDSSEGGAEEEIDLYDLEGLQDNFSAVGLRLQVLRLTHDTDNVGDVSIDPGVSSGYDLFGNDNGVTVPAGGRLTMEFEDGAPEVGPTERYLTLAGTDGDIVNLEMIFG
jgi:hypothetical protein